MIIKINFFCVDCGEKFEGFQDFQSVIDLIKPLNIRLDTKHECNPVNTPKIELEMLLIALEKKSQQVCELAELRKDLDKYTLTVNEIKLKIDNILK